MRGHDFKNEEIDYVLSYLNKTYARAKGIDVVGEESERLERYLRDKYGRALIEEQREYLRQAIVNRSEFAD